MVFDHWWNGIWTLGVYDRADVLNHGDGGPFFRLIERIHLAVDESGKNLGKGHGDLGLTEKQTRFDEAPLIMLVPLLVCRAVLVIGVYNQDVVNQIETFLQAYDLPKGVEYK